MKKNLTVLLISWILFVGPVHSLENNIYNKIDVELNTHDIDGISKLDFELSEFMNITFKKIEDE